MSELKLIDYALLEGSELGEACVHLDDLIRYDYCLSDEFVIALKKEAARQLDMFKTLTRITEKEETQTYKVKALEWINE